ncbi:MAG: SAM-dependent chlorinase/fluorinase, partial [Thermoplasmata archaeon]
DNGILSYILSQSSFRAFKIENKNYILKPNSPTFQGRDIFASAAAWLLRGVPINELGEEIRDPITFKVEEPVEIRDGGERKIIGKIIYIDKFGNCISNIQVENLKIKRVFLRGLEIPLVRFYGEAKEGLSALVNSDGLLELFLYMGNASKEFGIERNQTVEVISDG